MQSVIQNDISSKIHQYVVAIVEDDVLLRQEIVSHLNANHFETHGVSSAAALDDLVTLRPIDIYIWHQFVQTLARTHAQCRHCDHDCTCGFA